MKKMFLGVCLILISHWISAQQMAGKVTDASTGTPIPSATVEIPDIASTITDNAGNFLFKKIKAGNYTVRISSIGYQTQEKNISSKDNLVEFKLERWNLFLQPVEIKAIRAGEKSPFTKTDISKKEIEKQNIGQDLPFILNQTPSVVINSDAGTGIGYTGIHIRGTDATRINVTLNGIPYNDAESLGTYWVDIPDFSSSVNNIQIQRGVGTSSNGAGAFGATINLSTNEVNTSPYAESNNSYGSYNSWKTTIKAGSGLIDNHFTIDARLSRISSDGYIDRATSDLRSFYLSGAWLSAKTSIRFNVFSGTEKTYQAWNGIPEAKLLNDKAALQTHYENNIGSLYFTTGDSLNLFNADPRKYNYFTYQNQTDNYQQDQYQLFINHALNTNLSINTAFFLVRGRGYYEEYKPQQSYTDYGLEDPVTGTDTITQTDLIRQLWLDNYFYGQIFSLQYKNTRDQFTFGGGWNRYDGKHYGFVTWSAMGGIPNDYRWYYNKAYKTDINLYAKYQRKLSEHFQSFLDLQYRRVLHNIDGFDDNPSLIVHKVYNFFNPKIGITYSANDLQVYASYSMGNKEPNRDDFQASESQQPKAEKLNDIELGIERKNSQYNWGATFYYMAYSHQLVLTGKINDVGAYTRTNVPSSYRTGIELQGGIRFNQWLQASGNITFSSNRIKNFTEYYDDYDNGGQKSVYHGTTDIAFSPNITGAATIAITPVRRLELDLLSKYVSRQYLDNTSNIHRSLNPYYVQDARLSYLLRHFLFKETTFALQVNNIFNKKYEPNGYTYSYQYNNDLITENFYFPMATTNIMFSLNVKL